MKFFGESWESNPGQLGPEASLLTNVLRLPPYNLILLSWISAAVKCYGAKFWSRVLSFGCHICHLTQFGQIEGVVFVEG